MLLGLTGGIATGKSTATRFLADRADFRVFDADACVHELLSADAAIIASVRRSFGLTPFDFPTPIDRAALRQLVFADPAARRQLEEILHPVVRQQWQALRAVCLAERRSFLADIPLLFETGASSHFDTTILVAASPATQRARLGARGLTPDCIEGMLASQWPIGQKIPLADHVIWNDGSPAELERQCSLLLDQLLPRAA
jgi:dephospho-CoA kinase